MTIRDVETAKLLLIYLKSYNSEQNRTITEVARQFGVTRQDIRIIAKRYGVELCFTESKGRTPEDAMDYRRASLMEKAGELFTQPEAVHQKGDIVPERKRMGKEPMEIPVEKQAYLRENYAIKPVTVLIKESGLSKFIVKRFLDSEGLKRPTQTQLMYILRGERKKARLAEKEAVKRAKVKEPKVIIPEVITPERKKRGPQPKVLPESVQTYLRENVNQPWTQLAQHCGCTLDSVRRFMKDNGLKREYKKGSTKVKVLRKKKVRNSVKTGYKGRKPTSLPEAVQTFLKENASRSWTHLSKECGYTLAIVKYYLQSKGYTRPGLRNKAKVVKEKQPRSTKPKEKKPRGKKPYEFSEEDKAFITSDFSKTITSIARVLGVSEAIIKKYLISEGLYRVKPRKKRVG